MNLCEEREICLDTAENISWLYPDEENIMVAIAKAWRDKLITFDEYVRIKYFVDGN